MKFVIAPDKFKGSLDGPEFCTIACDVLRDSFPHAEIVELPLADGGDGTIEVVRRYIKGKTVTTTVNDPLFRPIECDYLFSLDTQTAFIEMAVASGHRLLKPYELDCMETTTLGTGELIKDAIDRGASHIFLGIGGSATNDGGMGMAQALGYSFLDTNGNPLAPIGKNLEKVTKIVAPEKDITTHVTFKIACDVDNPFYGDHGAAKVYAQQKGATSTDIEALDRGLEHFALIVKPKCKVDLQKIPGAGAAGGVGGAAVAFLGATLLSGIDFIKEIAHFDANLQGADWVLTGEGKLDVQTFSGKTIEGVIHAAQKKQIPVAAFCGTIELSQQSIQDMGLTHAVAISEGIPSIQEAMARTRESLRWAIKRFAQQLQEGAL
ncbi:MAG: glycerate kinase [Flavobacteriaceae bacterium]